MSDSLRVDVLLDRLCITRSRNEAKTACDSGAVLSRGQPVKPSHLVSQGDTLTIRFPTRTVDIEVLEIPPKSVSKKAARELFRVLREERTAAW